ncbi:MAG: type II secretion system F family protein [Lachnospiraceae bacterium]|nr:type II secretion system F family protein [Lachnospiraceae bacterium]
MYWVIAGCLELLALLGVGSGLLLGRRKCEKGWMAAGYGVYALRRHLCRRLGIWESETTYYRSLYVNEKPEAVQLREGCLQGLVTLGIVAAAGMVILLLGMGGQFSATEVTELERPPEGTQVRKLIARVEENSYEVAVAVTERQLTAEEVRQRWQEARKALPQWILGENAELNSVSRDLELFSRLPGTAIEVQWFSSDYTLVDYEGRVNPENLTEASQTVVLTAELSYGDWKETMQIPVRIVRESGSRQEETREAILQILKESLEEQGYEEKVALPAVLQENEVKYYTESKQSPGMFLLLTIVLLVGFFAAAESSHKKKKQERLCQLQRDYPEIVSKLTLLLEAGMTIRSAWERIAGDYLRYGRQRERRRYAYEEILYTNRQMQIGMPENLAYAQFGKRCGTILYLRFSSVLVQNLQKGTKSIVPLLKKEAEEALCERKERARQLGEEAGTKLLLPMVGMLVLVLAIVMIPAFLSF